MLFPTSKVLGDPTVKGKGGGEKGDNSSTKNRQIPPNLLVKYGALLWCGLGKRKRKKKERKKKENFDWGKLES